MHHPPQADTEDTEDNETKKISEILCALCGESASGGFIFLVSKENSPIKKERQVVGFNPTACLKKL
jgi:hypothetical protein